MPAIFFASRMPPTRASAGCRIAAACRLSKSAYSYLVASRSPVATGMLVPRATTAISARFSGGTGSSNHSGSNCSRRFARRIAAAADRLAHVAHHQLRVVQLVQGKLVRVEHRHVVDRIELHRREALLRVRRGPLRRRHRVHLNRGSAAGRPSSGDRLRVQVGVGAQPLVHLAAEQVVDRLVERLTDDVPAGNLDAAQHADHGKVGMLVVTAGVHGAPQALDPERIPAGDVALEDVLDEAGHAVRIERHAVHLAVAGDAVVGGQLQEHPVGAPLWGGGLATA